MRWVSNRVPSAYTEHLQGCAGLVRVRFKATHTTHSCLYGGIAGAPELGIASAALAIPRGIAKS